MEKIEVKEMSPKQCQVMVGKHRVAYVCYGEGKPINWLPRPVSGITLTEPERVEVAKFVREDMAKRNQAKESVNNALAELSSSNYVHPTKVKSNAVKQGSDSGQPDKTAG